MLIMFMVSHETGAPLTRTCRWRMSGAWSLPAGIFKSWDVFRFLCLRFNELIRCYISYIDYTGIGFEYSGSFDVFCISDFQFCKRNRAKQGVLSRWIVNGWPRFGTANALPIFKDHVSILQNLSAKLFKSTHVPVLIVMICT